jgi:hypothetical protein
MAFVSAVFICLCRLSLRSMPGSPSRRYFMREQYLVHISLFFSISIYTTLGRFEARSQKLICLCDNCLHSFKLQHQRAASWGPPVVFFPQMALSLRQVCVKWLPTSESGFSNILNRVLSVWQACQSSHIQLAIQRICYEHGNQPAFLCIEP